MNNELIEYLKTIKGNVIAIGIDDINIVNTLENNSNILNCHLIASIETQTDGNGKTQKILPRHIKQMFKKKSIDYFILNHNLIKDNLSIYIKNSIYLTRGKAIIMTDDKKLIKDIYKRYNVKIEDKGFLIIDINDTKINKFKQLKYDFLDKTKSIADYISDSLTN